MALKLCTWCKHFKTDHMSTTQAQCWHPNFVWKDFVYGGHNPNDAYEMRKTHCNARALLFEPKEADEPTDR